MLCAILTSGQVTSIFGAPTGSTPQAPLLATSETTALQPRQLANGDWALPAAAIAAAPPAAVTALAGLAQRDVAASEWYVGDGD